MLPVRLHIEQTNPPRSPKETLPTMYDLPSEDPEEPGLPDEYHYLQPQLLSATLRVTSYPPDRVFSVGDMNLYYDSRHPGWYKRPDWFAVMGVPRLYEQQDMRLSYVVWQEGIDPFVVVELLSPATEREDLGEMEQVSDRPPTKWEVYEQILRVPYYVLFDRYDNRLRAFRLVGASYQALDVSNRRVWMSEIALGLGVWQGAYQGVERLWLRWYGADDRWIPTDAEAAEQKADEAEQRANQAEQRADEAEQRADEAEQRANQAEQRAERLAQHLRELGVDFS